MGIAIATPDPARDLNAYVLFGYQSLSFKGDDAGGPTQTRGLIVGGHVGVNAVDPHDPPTPLLNMCGGGSVHRVWMSDGTQVVADTAALQSPCNLYNLFVNRLTGGSPPLIRNGGATAFTAPIIDPAQLPAVPSFSPGTTPITVNSNTTVNLAPGSYGLVWVKDDGTLTLSAGTYQIGELTAGKRVHINTTDGTVLLIASEFGVNNDAVVGPACGAQIWARSDGVGSNDFSVHFSKHSEVHGQFFAPNGIMSLGDDTDLFGRFIGRDVHSGWNTNVTYCAGGGAPQPSSTPTISATATATATSTLTSTASPTSTATRTHSLTPTATATSTPLPSSTATATEAPSTTASATATDSATPTDTATQTATPTATPPATATSTTTQIPSGALVGEVFDDATAQALAGVQVIAAAGVSAGSDASGRYALPALSVGDRLLLLSASGYTRSVRRVEVDSSAAARVRDARLTPLGAPQAIGGAGGTLSFPAPAPLLASPGDGGGGGTATLELVIAASTLPDGTTLRLTGLSPQGLIAPPPLGWSVLLGVDVQVETPPSSPASASLRVPLALLSAAAGAPIVSAIWDDASAQWRGGPPVLAVGSNVEIAGVPIPLEAETQIALLVGDSMPSAPPSPAADEPLQGVSAALAAADSAAVRAAPPVIVSMVGAGATVLTRVDGATALPSGTLLEARLRETYDLRDGSHLLGTHSRQDLAGYQRSASASGTLPSPAALGATFALVPSRSFVFGELMAGRVLVDVSLPQAEAVPGLVDAEGGVVNGPGGVSLSVPANVAGGPVVLEVQPVLPEALPDDADARPDFAGALAIDISGGSLDPTAAYGLGLGQSLPDGERFAIARVEVVDQRSLLVLIGVGHSTGGAVVLDACPAGIGACLAGLGGSGTYAVFDLADDDALVTGTVRDANGARSQLAVGSDASVLHSVTSASGRYVLPAPASVTTTFTCRDRANDLAGSATVSPLPELPPPVLTGADIDLISTPPRVVQSSPPNHASQVDRGAALTLTFSEPVLATTVTDASVQLLRVASSGTTPVDVRRSVGANGTQLVVTPNTLLEPDALYRLELSAAITDPTGAPLEPFESDFTTAVSFTAASLPPNTLRVSLPDDDGRVFVCGGAQLAVPGTLVDVINDTTGEVVTVLATDLQGVSGSDVCETRFPDRCDTSLPGSFCGVVGGDIGETIQVQVEDPFGNLITLDAGNMRDERTGATAIGPEGGVVFAAEDPRYQLLVPAGAFESPTVVSVRPVANEDFPNPAEATMELIGAVQLDFGGVTPLSQVDIAVPAPPDASVDDQYLATEVVNFRGQDDLKPVDTAFWDQANDLIVTDPGVFAGLTFQGLFGVVRTKECVAFVTGFAAIGEHYSEAFVPGGMMLPFPIVTTERLRYTVPVPCNRPVEVSLNTLAGEEIDFLSLSTAPAKGEFVFVDGTLTDDKTPPVVIPEQASVPAGGTDVGHDSEISIPFSEAIDSNSIAGNIKLICTIHGQDVEMQGDWSQSADGKRLFFIPLPSQPQHGLPLGTHCRIEVKSGLKDLHKNTFGTDYALPFTTFQPAVVDQIPNVDAVAVDSVGWRRVNGGPNPNVPLLKQFIAFAEGDSFRFDSQGGVLLQEVTDLQTVTAPPITLGTSGFDYAVRFVPPEPITDSEGHQFFGPYLMTVDGPGGPESRRRFGVWRLFDLADFENFNIPQIAVRSVNLSSDASDVLNSLEGNQSPETLHFLRQIPNDLGIPLDVASIGATNAYIANAPTIGLETIQVQGIDRDPEKEGVDNTLPGHFRSVTTLTPWVIGARADGLVVTGAGLVRASGLPDGPPDQVVNGVVSVLSLPSWPVDKNRNGRIELSEQLDLIVANCFTGIASQPALCISAFDTASGHFAPQKLQGVIPLPPGSLPRRMFADPERRLLYLANGTTGLTVIDLQDPSGTLDDSPHDDVDDRVIANIPLNNGSASARDVAMDINVRDPALSGNVIAFVAARRDGWFMVDLGPARMSTRLIGYSRDPDHLFDLVEADEVRYFNEKPHSVYQPEIQLPGHLADLYPDEVQVTVETVDKNGNPVPVPAPSGGPAFAPAVRQLTLQRVPQTNRYTLSRTADGKFRQAVVVSNLPLDDGHSGGLQPLLTEFNETYSPNVEFFPLYGGIGAKLRITANVEGSRLKGKVRKVPVEKVQVIFVAIDGLRQDVLYPGGENLVNEDGALYYADPATLPGLGQLFGGRLAGADIEGNLDQHVYRFPEVTSVFPSITYASWASIFTSRLPKDTGLQGNEFFARDLVDTSVPREPPHGLVNAQGMLTISEGVFPRGARDLAALTPPVPFYKADPAQSTQNVTLRGVETLFEQSKPILERSLIFRNSASMIGTMNLYARGLDAADKGPNRWLTPNAKIVYDLWRAHGSGASLDTASGENANHYLVDHFLSPPIPLEGHRNGEPFPGLFVLYMAGLDHEAHSVGHGPHGQHYVEFLRTSTDARLREFADSLRFLDEYYNKLIVLTTDHGHTAMKDVPDDLAPCEILSDPSLGGTEAARQNERDLNTNLSGWELGSLFDALNDAIVVVKPNAVRQRLLMPEPVVMALGPGADAPPGDPDPGELDTDTTRDLSEANVIAALNGPMAHIYVKNAVAENFNTPPAVVRDGQPAEVAIVAEYFRVLLGQPTLGTYLGPSFWTLRKIRTYIAGAMADSIDFILYRDPGTGVYRVFDGLDPTTGAVLSRDLETFFQSTGDRFVRPLERIAAMNDPQRSGDIIVHFRFDSSAPIPARYTCGTACRSWHGGLGRADSYVPLIAAYPGGSKHEFLAWWDQRGGKQHVCPAGGNENFDCHGNWLMTDLVVHWLDEMYPPAMVEVSP